MALIICKGLLHMGCVVVKHLLDLFFKVLFKLKLETYKFKFSMRNLKIGKS